jgi:hypothetical protein
MTKKYVVRLSDEERGLLEDLVSKGQAAAQKIKHANVLLKVDAEGANWSDAQAAEAFGCAPRTVFSIRERFVEQGFEAALSRKQRERPSCEPLLDGEKQARLVQIACSEPPPGYARWTLNLLAGKLVELDVVESISAPTVMRALKKRTPTASAQVLGDSPRGRRRLCGANGRCPGGLPPPLRPQEARCLH